MEYRMLYVLLVVMCLAAGPTWADEIVIRFSHVVAPDTPKGKAADFFAERAAALTNGRVRVQVYPNSTLYRDREEMEALQLGAVQMLAPSLAKFSVLGVSDFELFDLPYIFADRDALARVTEGPIGRRLLGLLEPRGIKGLAFWDNGFKSFSANRPIRSPEDMVGLRMRIQASKVLEAQMQALGATPVMMAFSDVYPALSAGVVDGTENPHSNLYTQRMHEVQRYLTVSDHGYLGYAVITSKRFWDSLPRAVRRQLEQAMREASEYANRIAYEENVRALEAVRAAGTTTIIELDADQRAEFRRALLPVHELMAGRIGSDLIRSVYRETGFDPLLR
ncbi:TRAP transporter substrate-binding protein [Azoarcus taiwanensis]|uniref:DctP family TRAP transporter solute-binding subunit n=1 Tax=Azoarcus taiwanensis TaxID=666964 RepID=A0A972J991_9RHOO|nr:TRAP transporter substrate-binding protein [Azoarcus taiwanensis]NMG01733.1 DctP family TRAP transporter solute-binding subunit [Azoarcus taiwanensis]